MSRIKAKIILFAVLAVVGLIVGFFFSGLINLALTSSFESISDLEPNVIINSILTSDRHRLLFFCVELFVIAGISVLLLMNKRESFESEVTNITETIPTPIAVGQGQHGTARWLKKDEKSKVFSVYRYDRGDPIINALVAAGLEDRKEVELYAAEQAKREGEDPAEKIE